MGCKLSGPWDERNDILAGPSGTSGDHSPSWALQEASLL